MGAILGVVGPAAVVHEVGGVPPSKRSEGTLLDLHLLRSTRRQGASKCFGYFVPQFGGSRLLIRRTVFVGA